MPDIVNAFKVICVQSKVDTARFLSLEFPRENVITTGNIKYDLVLNEAQREEGLNLRENIGRGRPVWIAASTHPGEEEQVLFAHKKILEKNPKALLILVPRHPERFAPVGSYCESQGFEVITRSSGELISDRTQVFLGDSLGEMTFYYACSDVAFVGGSLVSIGGHNLLEPALQSLPIVTGTYLFNFEEISQKLIDENGLEIVQSKEELIEVMLDLLQFESKRSALGEAAKGVVLENQGALDKIYHHVESFL